MMMSESGRSVLRDRTAILVWWLNLGWSNHHDSATATVGQLSLLIYYTSMLAVSLLVLDYGVYCSPLLEI